MLEPINLSAFADPILDELVSGEPKIDGTLFLDIIRQANGPILELGCGYGRITIPLAQHGIKDLTGLELSAPSLAYARSKAGDLPIHWVEGDVRDFHLNRRFSLIFARGCVFDFMLTRADQEAMLARVHAHLADDGRFMVDTMSKMPKEMVNAPDEFAWFTLTHPNGREIYVSGTDRFDYARQHWIQTCYERWDKPDGELVRPPNELILRYTMPQDMESILHYNGFSIVEKYADYDGTPVTEDQPATVFICEKAVSQKAGA
jgi:SAM-dependent methyltransferase